jgi:hypothetical protein
MPGARTIRFSLPRTLGRNRFSPLLQRSLVLEQSPKMNQKEQLANHKEHKERKEWNLGKGLSSPAR